MTDGADLIIGIDAGTSVIKAIAFDLTGRQIAASAVRNRYELGPDGSATQSLPRTWAECVVAIKGLSKDVDNLASRVVAIALTGQGDGTWLVGEENKDVCDAWIWLDGRAAPTVARLKESGSERARFEATGTGLNTCQQGTQLAHMAQQYPNLLNRAEVALHCKDWLFLNLTGVRATDPSEACFTFGDFRSRTYSDTVLSSLGLYTHRNLLPPIIDGSKETMPLCNSAAESTGLLEGTPVTLGYVDMVMTTLGAGVHTGEAGVACSAVGSTGVHMRSVRSQDVHLNKEGSGYVICLPVENMVTQVQTNMAATLNIDWILSVAHDLLAEDGQKIAHDDLVKRIDGWMARSKPGGLVYHPYISDAGERGPFVDAKARASLIGMNLNHRFPDLLRAVVESLGMAARDCYQAMGEMPRELRLTGGAARSPALREILASCLNVPVSASSREEAGAAGCAMMAAVAIGVYPDMDACIAEWVTPLLGNKQDPNPDLVSTYETTFQTYQSSRKAMAPVWQDL